MKPETRRKLEQLGILSDPNETREDRLWSGLIVGLSVILAVMVTLSMDLGYWQGSLFAVVAGVLITVIGTAIRLKLSKRGKP